MKNLIKFNSGVEMLVQAVWAYVNERNVVERSGKNSEVLGKLKDDMEIAKKNLGSMYLED